MAVFGMGRFVSASFMFLLGGTMQVLPYWEEVPPCTPPSPMSTPLLYEQISKVLCYGACVIVSATIIMSYLITIIVNPTYAM